MVSAPLTWTNGAYAQVFVCPVLLWVTGAISGLDGRTSFLLGNTVNQISEFSLILANQAVALGIFSPEMYLTIVVAALICFVFSSLGHLLADRLYDGVLKHLLGILDRRSSMPAPGVGEFVMHAHVVLLGFNAIALEIAEYYRQTGVDVIVIHLDPKLHGDLQDLYRLGRPKAAAVEDEGENVSPLSLTAGCGTNIYSQYADPTKPDTWHHYHLTAASIVVSCEFGTTESDCVLARELSQHKVPFLAVADRCSGSTCLSRQDVSDGLIRHVLFLSPPTCNHLVLRFPGQSSGALAPDDCRPFARVLQWKREPGGASSSTCAPGL